MKTVFSGISGNLEKRQKIRVFLSLTAVFMLSISGCSTPEEYKQQADEEVYSILDQKWKDRFGYMANYKVTDGEPNALEVIKMIPSSKILSQAQAVGISTKYNRNYQSQKDSLYLSALDLTSIRHRYALQWFGTIDAAYTVSEGTEETPFNSQVGASQQFLLGDGILIGAGLAVDWTRFLTGDPDASLGSVLSSTLEAPLLGNGAGKAARENLTQAERGVLYNIRTFNRYRKTFVVSTISDYYRVLQQKASVEIQKASYSRQVDSTNQLRMEVEVGKRPAYDLGEAQQSLLGAEQNVVTRTQEYEQALDFFKIKLALPTDVDIQLDPNELMILDTIGVSQPDYSAEEAIQMALVQRLDLANMRDRIDDAERKLILTAEGLGPQINLVGSANVDSTPDTEVTRLRFHEGTYSMGVAVDLPFDRLDERNTYRESLISVRTRQRDYDEKIDTIKLQIRASYRSLVQTAESYRIQKIGLELAKKRVEVEKLSLQYGRGTVRLLLDSEDALVKAQDEVVVALVDHVIAKLNFFRDVGVLRVKPDGMWEQEEI
jgi:outer membrane protein TolC